ncbi:MAG: cytochrome ubiquinol oxidase subunit I [Bacteroidales bacterium]|nr:cytochrome ubiquinol oxidase subunit I [Bacteroidales bacterium]
MDVVLLSRIQFGFAAGFHFLFPPLTLGLTLVIFIL